MNDEPDEDASHDQDEMNRDELWMLSMKSESFDFWNDDEEDIYSAQDGSTMPRSDVVLVPFPVPDGWGSEIMREIESRLL